MENHQLECNQYSLGQEFMRAIEFLTESVEQNQPGVAESNLNEYRDQLWTWVKSKFPRTQWPEYVQRDFLYAKAKGNKNRKDLEDFLDEVQRDFGRVKWQLEKLPITLDIFTPKTQRMIQSREGGSSNPYQVPKDAERHSLQQKMIQQKGVSQEPIIVAKLSNGYDLIEGWHRTIQHLKEFPQGYTAPAWVGYGATYTSESVEQGVAEGLDEAVGGNYLYHATMPAGMMRILRTGIIKATDRPQPSTKSKTQYPTISTTRSKQYAESNDFVDFLNLTKDGNSVILVFDRNTVANHYKMFSTSQGTQTVGDEYEEVIVAPKGSMPIKGTLKGFYFNPRRTEEIEGYQDVPWFNELLNSPYYMGQKQGVAEGLNELTNTSLKVKQPKDFVNTNDRKQVTWKVMKFKSGKDTYLINFTMQHPPAFGKKSKSNWNAVNVAFGVKEPQDEYSFGDEINTDLTARNKNQFLIYSTVINAIRKFITEYNTEIDEIIMQGAGERQQAMYQRFFQSAGKYFPGWHYNGKHSLVRDVPRQPAKKVQEQGVAEGNFDSFKFGKPITFTAYHSSDSEIKKILPTDEFYFSDDRYTWEGNYLYKIKITLKNPYVVLDQKAGYEGHATDSLPKIKAAGYDGVIYTPHSVDYGFRQGVCFYPQQQISNIKLVNSDSGK